METIKVEIFYGEYNQEFIYDSGLVFFFDTYKEAINFVSFVENHSNCNALIIQSFDFDKKAGE